MISLRYAPPVLWVVLVLVLGSASFAARETATFVLPVLKAVLPGVPVATLEAIHMVLRKMCHLTEYAVLALLWFRALLARARQTPRAAAWIALGVCLLCAFVDEAHQAMLPARTGSARDLVIDAAGALGMLIVLRGRRPAGGVILSGPRGRSHDDRLAARRSVAP